MAGTINFWLFHTSVLLTHAGIVFAFFARASHWLAFGSWSEHPRSTLVPLVSPLCAYAYLSVMDLRPNLSWYQHSRPVSCAVYVSSKYRIMGMSCRYPLLTTQLWVVHEHAEWLRSQAKLCRTLLEFFPRFPMSLQELLVERILYCCDSALSPPVRTSENDRVKALHSNREIWDPLRLWPTRPVFRKKEMDGGGVWHTLSWQIHIGWLLLAYFSIHVYN